MKTFKYVFSAIAIVLLIGALYFLGRVGINADTVRSSGTQLRVVIADEVGVPLGAETNPTVTVIPEDRQGTRTTSSQNQEGYYVIPLVSGGTYKTEVSANGYVSQTRTVTLQDRQTVDSSFYLQKTKE